MQARRRTTKLCASAVPYSLAMFFLLLLSGRAVVPVGAKGSPDTTSFVQDGTVDPLTRVAGAGMINSHVYHDLEELSDDIGPRLTGSPQVAKAIEWALAKMRAKGLTSVHAETWQLTRGWSRGSAAAEIIEPIHRALAIDSMGWVGSTPADGVDADVVAVDASTSGEEAKRNSAAWSHKVLLVRPSESSGSPQNTRGYIDFLRLAESARAAAVIGGRDGSRSEGMHMTHTGILSPNTFFESLPVVSMTAEDQRQILRFLDHGRPVRIHINIQNRFTAGSVEAVNAVGEIKGTQDPEQIIVVGAHLDSWDLAQGSTDNGTGVACVLGAAEAITTSGFRPKRTIRFVLFTGEEQGTLGSLAYTNGHRGEMKDHVAALVLDTGQGPINQFAVGHNEIVPAIRGFAAAIQGFGDVLVNDWSVVGTDTGPFLLAGIPGILLGQDSPDYRYTHHSSADTFDKVQPDILIRNATLMGLLAFWIADRPERLSTPWEPQRTAKMLIERHQDEHFKVGGLWPFGSADAEWKDQSNPLK